MRLLFIGDIVGRGGRRVVKEVLPTLIQTKHIEFTIANGENAAGGFGITRKVYDELLGYGIDAFTSGNHIDDKNEALAILTDPNTKIIRPDNYKRHKLAGPSFLLTKTKSGKSLSIVNVMGRVYMKTDDCPFKSMDVILESISDYSKCIVVDIHAEATSEKRAFGFFLDGKVSAIIGTHTHITTADECILPNGTGYITDIGMTGCHDSVIGMRKKEALKRFLTGEKITLESATGPSELNALIMDIDDASGKTTHIERIRIKEAIEN